MNVKIIKTYDDLELGRRISVGDTITVTDLRGAQLIDAGVAEAVEDYTATIYENKRNKKAWGVQDDV